MQYLTLSRCEDEVHIGFYSEVEVKRLLNDEWRGFTHLDKVDDLDCFPSRSVFLFKGNVVIPKPVEIVTEYRL